MSFQTTVTPEELDAWLRSSNVDEKEGETTISDTIEETNECSRKQSYRRLSSLDQENISRRPSFGIDAETMLLASKTDDDVQGENGGVFAELYPYIQSVSQCSNDSHVNFTNAGNTFQDITPFKKRRVSHPGLFASKNQSNQYYNTHNTKNASYLRCMTESITEEFNHEAQWFMCSSGSGVDSHSPGTVHIHQTRSCHTFSQDFELFLCVMEASQRTHCALLPHQYRHHHAMNDATKNSASTRRVLIQLTQRNIIKLRMAKDLQRIAREEEATRFMEELEAWTFEREMLFREGFLRQKDA